jgi:hypothetical protein
MNPLCGVAGSKHGETPLWYYILREADVCAGGHRLGPMGGRIVAEVLVGLIDADARSFRRSHEPFTKCFLQPPILVMPLRLEPQRGVLRSSSWADLALGNIKSGTKPTLTSPS